MAETIISKQIIRRGNIQQLPILATGEFGLAENEQRLFLGQNPITKSDYTVQDNDTVSVTFETNFEGSNTVLDMDKASKWSYYIEVYDYIKETKWEIGPAGISTNDGTFTFNHLLKDDLGADRAPVIGQDTFTLYWNKEITNSGNYAPTNFVQSTYLKKAPPFNPLALEDTGVTFSRNIKDSITLDYSIYIPNTTDSRQGTLIINLIDDTNSSITDQYTMSSDTLDIEFAVSSLSPGIFTLQFNTTHTGTIQFNYIEKSYKRLVSVSG